MNRKHTKHNEAKLTAALLTLRIAGDMIFVAADMLQQDDDPRTATVLRSLAYKLAEHTEAIGAKLAGTSCPAKKAPYA